MIPNMDPALKIEMAEIKQKLDASEKSSKRMLDELEGLLRNRDDKDKRYKQLMAQACSVPKDVVEKIIDDI